MKPLFHRHCRTGLRLGLGLSLMAGAVQAQIPPRQYQANFETADWQVESGGRMCALSHEVPGFGTVRFVQNWAEPMRFQVRVPMAVSSYDSVSIRSTPAPWQHHGEIRELGRVRVGDTMQPVDMRGETVRALLSELQEGRFTRLGWKKPEAVVEEMQVTVPSVRLRLALPEFQRCLAGVMQLDFMPAGEYRVDFENDSTRLGYLARRGLEPAIQRYKASRSGIGRIVVAGHADSKGSTSANERVSLERARAVRDYLVERGIPRQRIEVRGYGERWELDPGNPESNRRATVWLVER
jgi:outer membrane protein OmpA-like peptidoglycan-associated protein